MFFNYYLQNKNITNDTIHFSIKGLQEFSTQTNNVNFVICSKYLLHSKKVKNLFLHFYFYIFVCVWTLIRLSILVCMFATTCL